MGKLPVLMYHAVSRTVSEGLTISVEKLEAQFSYLAEAGYRSIRLDELRSLQNSDPGKNIAITFDDAYVNQMKLAIPLLKKYNLKALFFVPLAYLGKTDEWNTAAVPIMTAEELKNLDPEVVELGFHSFYHKRYDELTPSEIEDDHRRCMEAIKVNNLSFSNILAYPFGKYPKSTPHKELFFDQLRSQQFEFGFRIGNRLNTLPFKNPYEIQRLDIKGEYSLSKFKRKIRFGKLI